MMTLLVCVHRPVKVQLVLPASSALALSVRGSTSTTNLLWPICAELLNMRSWNSAATLRSSARELVLVPSHTGFWPEPFGGLVLPAVDRMRCSRPEFALSRQTSLG